MEVPLYLSQKRFLEASLISGALKFGEFVTNAKRKTPYFFNSSKISDGKNSHLIGISYGQKIFEEEIEYDVVFGPAYKGIPLAIQTVDALEGFDVIKRFAYNRKEAKDHGDTVGEIIEGNIKNGDKVVIVDDVISSGITQRNAIDLIRSDKRNLEVVGVVVGLNRMEVSVDGNDPVKEIMEKHGVPVHHIIDSKKMFNFLHNKKVFGKYWVNDERYEQFQKYMEKYGV